MEWMQRAKREDTKYAKRRSWYSKCKRYKVTEVEILYGAGRDERGNLLGYPITYEAKVKREIDWKLISEHTKCSAAKAALEYLENKGKPKPKQTKAVKAINRQKAKRKMKRKQSTETT